MGREDKQKKTEKTDTEAAASRREGVGRRDRPVWRQLEWLTKLGMEMVLVVSIDQKSDMVLLDQTAILLEALGWNLFSSPF